MPQVALLEIERVQSHLLLVVVDLLHAHLVQLRVGLERLQLLDQELDLRSVLAVGEQLDEALEPGVGLLLPLERRQRSDQTYVGLPVVRPVLYDVKVVASGAVQVAHPVRGCERAPLDTMTLTIFVDTISTPSS
jgi:hypothetical protein